ncbi:MAG: TetR/AcrR family transcriptional regulator [Akkermansiaceae bacterium]
MEPRKKQPEQTRNAILDAVDAEFSHGGYAATGIGAIVLRSGLTKGALFHHFADKQKLALAWIGEILARSLRELWIEPLERAASLDDLLQICRQRCSQGTVGDATSALVATAAEVAARDAVLGGAMETIFADWRAAVAALLERGRSGGWIHPSIQPPIEAALLVSAFAGFTVALRVAESPETRAQFLTGIAAYLETLRVQTA